MVQVGVIQIEIYRIVCGNMDASVFINCNLAELAGFFHEGAVGKDAHRSRPSVAIRLAVPVVGWGVIVRVPERPVYAVIPHAHYNIINRGAFLRHYAECNILSRPPAGIAACNHADLFMLILSRRVSRFIIRKASEIVCRRRRRSVNSTVFKADFLIDVVIVGEIQIGFRTVHGRRK